MSSPSSSRDSRRPHSLDDWCATMVKFQKKTHILVHLPPLLKKTSSGVNVPVETSLHYEKNTFTIQTRPPNLFEKKHAKAYPKNRSKLTIEKKTTKHSQCPPPSPHSAPQHAESLLEGVNSTPPGWKNRWKGVEVCESLGRTEFFFSGFFSSIDMSKTSNKLQKRQLYSQATKKQASKLQNRSSSQKIIRRENLQQKKHT